MRQINLIPVHLIKNNQKIVMRNLIIIHSGIMIVLILAIHFTLSLKMYDSKKMMDQPALQVDSPDINRLRNDLIKSQQEIMSFFEENKNLVELKMNYLSYPIYLKNLGVTAKNKVWFNHLSFDERKKEAYIEGTSFNTRLVSEFMLELKKLSFLKNVELINMGKETKTGLREVHFKIVCHYH